MLANIVSLAPLIQDPQKWTNSSFPIVNQAVIHRFAWISDQQFWNVPYSIKDTKKG